MKAEWVHPFLQSACSVIEQILQVRPERGELELLAWHGTHDLHIQIALTGQMSGVVAFGLKEGAAVKMASAMMGGYPLETLDAMGESAISELGNMISGNASTMLYNQGIHVDILPPQLVPLQAIPNCGTNAMAVPLHVHNVGRLDIMMKIEG
ncbi:chemotaxis protein CheX [Paenibacillus agilis]|uniref:Chemotaxis protein CheX n=1 Tax=Paenibacillus agilis TaxID=3020863 RepID=A0A559IHP2_9BACL|nr:chemotaxis protein CheX [Paenibacillus agilis]TVX87154.1 chemotaxis protein CheX [Paenibacillus agilis]